MEKNTRAIVMIVGAIAVLGAYFVGQNSTNPIQPVNIPSTLNTNNNEPTPNMIQKKSVNVATDLTIESANGLACKNIASESAKANQLKTNRLTSVLKSHYSLRFHQCYYELFISIDLSGKLDYGTTDTEIRFAPDDDWIAWCSYDTRKNTTICNEHNHQGLETEQIFNQIEDLYFTN